MIRCVRIWSGDDGDSYFEEGSIDLADGARGDLLSGKATTISISFQETKSGGTFAWHDAPVRQFVITLSGTLDFQTRKGDHFVIPPATSCWPRILPAAAIAGGWSMTSRGAAPM